MYTYALFLHRYYKQPTMLSHPDLDVYLDRSYLFIGPKAPGTVNLIAWYDYCHLPTAKRHVGNKH